ncbi:MULTISPECIES: DUF4396 domain-containing protein [Acidobacterium]|uniref:Putative membrane protein n=1 Tax=Acidobacterium capsulatum (strain ATCC 51196 / DSM 11244 / BCRC 80197 / JCM 7670 / NBRC 15755 / NCIMB 13165 / 161) TaxID=240015 RepID=C1F9F9_ACIC5|nr:MULTISPECIES: DUF4396 domain-containing protein [Acidobacterium]ACO33520.1 putative membrane protein [Acidobacterium capsulatum ATCC 51196]HCT62172.1 DUF4396 domain-containing protein [Acidobacterium sp.]
MLAEIAWISLGVAFACALIIALDEVRHPQKMGVMNLVWPITALYLSVFALWGYFSFGRNKSGHGHHHEMSHHSSWEGNDDDMKMARRDPTWQQIAMAASHCGAGCTLADVVCDFGVFFAGLTLFGSDLLTKYIIDFGGAWLLGIAFQYFSIQPMRHLPVGQALAEAIKADTLSIAAFQVGMYGWMALSYFVFFPAPHLTPLQPQYWLMMQIAMVCGFLTTAPMNRWLVGKGIKEAMG